MTETDVLTAACPACGAAAEYPDCEHCGHVFEAGADDLTEPAREALRLAGAGVPVFPCKPDKAPLTRNGFKDASADPDQVRAWWAQYPYALPGVPTGKASGYDVLDIDLRPGKDGFTELAARELRLPQTRMHRTQSGGAHVLMRAAGLASSSGKIAPGVDVRGEGGYVIWWPAAGHTVEQPDMLADVPQWLLEAAGRRGNAPEAAPGRDGAVFVPPEVVRDLRSALTALRADDYARWIRIGHALTPLGEQGRALWLEWSQTSEKWQAADARRWATFQPTATGYEAVFAEAQRAGWLNPMSNAARSTVPAGTPGAGGATPDGNATPVAYIPLLQLADWRASTRFSGQPPEREYLVNGVFPMGKPALVASGGGLGKSFGLLDLAVKVATFERDAFARDFAFGGMVMRGGAVVYFTAEDDAAEVHGRLSALRSRPERLHIIPLPELPRVPTLFAVDPFVRKPGDTEDWRALCQQLAAVQDLALVVFDPLQPFCGMDLNPPENAQAVCTALASLAARTGAAVIVSHHMRKDGAKPIGSPEEARQAIRSSSALVDGVRCVYALWPAPEERAREACRALSIPLERDTVVHGAVVKANGPANRKVQTYIRNGFGLLINRTPDLGHAAPNTDDLAAQLVECIGSAADAGRPYQLSGTGHGLYARRHELPAALAALGRNRLQDLGQELLDAARIVKAAASNTLGNGTGPVCWLDVPNGPFASGRGTMKPGHITHRTES